MSGQTFKLIPRFVQAGAGAGKTTALTKHVYDSLSSYIAVNKVKPHFVVCTFTVKATQELRERLVGLSYKSNDVKMAEAIKDPACLSITTIHGLLNSLLKKYSLDLGLQPDFHLQDELVEERFRKKLCRELLLESDNKTILLEAFSFKEIHSILYELFLLYLESPTATVVDFSDLQRLLHEKSLHLVAEAKKILPLLSDAETLADFKAMLHSISQQSFDLKDIQNISLPRFSKKLNIDKEDWAEIKTFFDVLKGESDKAYWDLSFWKENLSIVHGVEQLFKSYQARMIEHKVIETKICLSEIEGVANYLFIKNPQVCEKIQDRIDYWYIDEFQDTSPVQWSILQKLIGSTPYYVVGDPQQSIYLFRGADVSLFKSVKEKFINENKEVISLETNYRSKSSLLSLVNDIFLPYGFLKMHAHTASARDVSAEVILHGEEFETSYQQIAGLIESLVESGKKLSDIAVLTKTNDELNQIQKYLIAKNIPVLVSASGGLFDNRLVRDLLYFLLFLVNPHNNEVLFTVLRNPIFAVSDDEIKTIFTNNKERSVWTEIESCKEDHKAFHILYEYYEKIKTDSFAQVLQDFIIKYGLLNLAFKLDASGLTYANVIKFQQVLKEQEKSSDFQIIRFVKHCLGYYLPLEESEAISPVMEDHVHLMTVHKSKGLEFDTVILPFMHKGFRASSPNLLLHDSDGLWTLPLTYGDDNKRQHNIFGCFEHDKQEEMRLSENTRLFYVAVTRAKTKVCFVGEEKYSSSSWFSLLPLRFLQEDECVNEDYIVQKKSYKDDVVFRADVKPQSTVQRAKDILQPAKRFSVTQILSTDIESSHTAVDAKKLLLSEHLGTKTHSLLERWRFHQDKALNTEVIDYLIQQDAFPFIDLMQVAEVEWGFSYKIKGLLMEGKVDLWGLVNGELWIVDYKTGSDAYRDRAFSQLQYYSLPIRHYTNINTAKLVVVYPFKKKVFVEEAEDVKTLLEKMHTDLANWQARSAPLIQSL